MASRAPETLARYISPGSSRTSRQNVPEVAGAATAVPVSEAHQDSWRGAASTQPGPVPRGGGAGTRRSDSASSFARTSAGRGAHAAQSRAPSFPGLMKPCLLGEGGEGITLSHPGLLATSEPGRRLGGSERAGLEPPEVGGLIRGHSPSAFLCPQNLQETRLPLGEWALEARSSLSGRLRHG